MACWLLILGAFFIGGWFGIMIMCIVIAARDADDNFRMEEKPPCEKTRDRDS